MSVAKRRSRRAVRVVRPKFLMLAMLLVGASLLSIATTFLPTESAYALPTSAQKTYCLTHFKVGDTVRSPGAAKSVPGWTENNCESEKVCETEPIPAPRVNPGAKVKSCNANIATADAQPDEATNKVLRDGYADAAAKSVCGKDTTCQQNVSTAAIACVNSFIANGYENDSSVVYPDVNTDIIADCIANKVTSIKPPALKKLKEDLKDAKKAVTAKATKSSEDKTKSDCEAGGGTWTNGKCETAEEDDEGTADCSPKIGAMGWIVCPVMNLIAYLNDQMYSLIAAMLVFDADTLKIPTTPSASDPNYGTYNAWSIFRSYANVAFVIAFLFIIISQVSSIGISNYGIKRMLPKLVIAAILVNISFYICQLLVDASNIAGYGLKALFDSIATSVTSELPGGGWTGITAAAVSFSTVGAAVGAVAIASQGFAILALLVPIILAAALALASVLLILVARQAIIILLIVVSPLAFVAYILPNTESWFKKWWKMLFTMLLLFPIVSVLFGASSLAAIIIANLGGAMQIVGAGISAIPLVATIPLVKKSLDEAGQAGATLKGWSNKATGGVGKSVGKQYDKSNFAMARKIRHAGQEGYRKKRLSDAISAGGTRGAILGGVGITGAQKAGQHHLDSFAQAEASREEAKEVDDEVIRMQKQSGWTEANRLDMAQKEFESAMRKGDATKARAAQKILLNGGNAGIGKLQNAYSDLGKFSDAEHSQAQTTEGYSSMMNSATGQKSLSDLNSSGVKGKNASLAKLGYTKPTETLADGSTKVNTVDSISTDSETYSSLNDMELAGQSADNLKKSGLSKERAEKMLANDSVLAQLDDTKRRIIADYAHGDFSASRTLDPNKAHEAAIAENARRSGGGTP